MLNSRHFRLFGALIGGFWGLAAAMEYEPFLNCTDAAQLDSSRVIAYKDVTLDPDLAPYTGYVKYQYFPRSCYPMRVMRQAYYLPDRIYRVDYQQGSSPGVFDFVWSVNGADSGFFSGTAFFSTSGVMDSGSYRFIIESGTGGFDTVFQQEKTVKTPQYQLIQHHQEAGHGALEIFWGDSIVSTTSGKTIYSVDEDDTIVTRCGNVGPTYVCEESPAANGIRSQKSIWFLTQGRKDSLQVWENGELISTEKYFWSARTAGIRTPRVRTNISAATSVWDEFDIMGRTRLDWSNADKPKLDRNNAWPRTRY